MTKALSQFFFRENIFNELLHLVIAANAQNWVPDVVFLDKEDLVDELVETVQSENPTHHRHNRPKRDHKETS